MTPDLQQHRDCQKWDLMFSDRKALSSLIAYNKISLVFSFLLYFFFNSFYFPNWILSEDFFVELTSLYQILIDF